MKICEQLKPKKVFQYFEEICNIPHGSQNTKAMSDYCVNFAKEHQLVWYQDQWNNVIITKEGTCGYENSKPLIIQGHMDMVCEKDGDTQIDFEQEGLRLYVEGDFLKAKGTTLGGDDGIAMAYAFAILDDKTLSHPPLEVILTVDEEVGMLGAQSIDISMLKGKKLLNIDSDEEGIFLTSCAGGLGAKCTIPVSYTTGNGLLIEIKVGGLAGGHSGSEIHKEHGNAIIIMGRVLKTLADEIPFALVHLEGGLKDNAIPRETICSIIVEEPGYSMRIKEIIIKLNEDLKKEFYYSDSEISVIYKKKGEYTGEVVTGTSFQKILCFLRMAPCGVQHMSMALPGLVETSLNVGIMKLKQELFSLTFSVRSSITSRKYDLTDQLSFLTKFLGGEVTISGDYPAWEYQADSAMRELMADTYRDLFQEEPKIQAIHAGLECGILSGKIEGLDCISFGPNNFDIHTPKERLSISSTEKIWKLLVEFLKRSK
ncbi:MAG: aminoacyl-histidine dipeptidase [Lachnospiraceae bacterium]